MPELAALCRFLNGEAFLGFARAVTGDRAIRLADVHASCYRAGDFLHRHNDHLDEKDGIRSAAYILNLTPVWRRGVGWAAELPARRRPCRRRLHAEMERA